jgi:hypothetical protein
MQVYSVHEPPDAPVDRIDRAERLKFIGDRFTPIAAAFGPFWLLANRIWFGFAMYALGLALVAVVVLAFGFGPRWIALMASAFNLVIGFEAASLQRMALEKRGWTTLGTVSGRNIDECERRFLETWLPDQRILPANGLSAAMPHAPSYTTVADGSSEGRLGRAPSRGWRFWRSARKAPWSTS